MEVTTPISWLSDFEMEDFMLFQEPYVTNSLYELLPQNIENDLMALNMNQNQHQRNLSLSSSTESNSNIIMHPTTTTTTATATTKSNPTRKQPRATNLRSSKPNTCSPVILNFGSSLLPKDNEKAHHQEEYVSSLTSQQILEDETEPELEPEPKEPPAKRKYTKRATTTTTSSTRDHIMAERRRREKLSQRYAALSALIPGLKRMDKTSILAEAIQHLKQLQDKIKELEEETAKKAVESVMLVKRSQLTSEDQEDINSSSCNEYLHSTSQGLEQLPEIEAKLSNKNILIKITCEKKDAVVTKILGAVENHNLSVTTVHATPFGDRTFNVTIIAQMEKDFDIRLYDILQDLSSACRK